MEILIEILKTPNLCHKFWHNIFIENNTYNKLTSLSNTNITFIVNDVSIIINLIKNIKWLFIINMYNEVYVYYSCNDNIFCDIYNHIKIVKYYLGKNS
jgi:hypothetical protein